MLLYTAVTVLTIYLAYFVCRTPLTTAYGTTRRQALSGACLIAVFTILFLLSALRMEVGNDYKNYAITCHEVWVDGHVVTEIGFNYLVKLVYTLVGHENYILVFAIFSFFTIYIFLKAMYQESDSFVLSIFLFMTLGIYFRTFNTMRYYLVLAVSLYALRYVVRKQYCRFIIIICIAALFHKSVLFVVPVYLVAAYVSKKWHYAVLCACGVGAFLAKDIIMKIALMLYPSYENTSYIDGNGGILNNLINNLPAIGQCLLVLILCVVFYKEAVEENKANRIYHNLNIFALLLYVCGYYLPLLSRFTYYMIIPHLLLVPGVICRIKDKKKRRLVSGITVVLGVIYFMLFLRTASSDGVRVLPYRTWIMDGMKEYLYYNEVF